MRTVGRVSVSFSRYVRSRSGLIPWHSELQLILRVASFVYVDTVKNSWQISSPMPSRLRFVSFSDNLDRASQKLLESLVSNSTGV